MPSLLDRLRSWRRLAAIERKLDRLQSAYYDAPEHDESTIVAYLAALAEARAAQRSTTGTEFAAPRLHLGSGGYRVEGWINLDIFPDDSVDVVADLTRPLPFRDASIARIHSEDVFEHIEREEGELLAAECHRVLEPGGVMRIVMPDLRAIVDRVYKGEGTRYLAWCARELDATTPCQALNMHMRMSGDHKFLYDQAELRALLKGAGFRPREVEFNRSRDPELRYLDLRNFGLSLYMEAVKT